MLNLLTVSWPLQSYIVAVLQQTNNSGHRIFLWVHMQKCKGLQRKPQREGPWCPHAVAQRRSSFQAAASIFTDYVAMELPRAKRYQHSINVVSRQPGWQPTIWLHRLEFLPANEILPNVFSEIACLRLSLVAPMLHFESKARWHLRKPLRPGNLNRSKPIQPISHFNV